MKGFQFVRNGQAAFVLFPLSLFAIHCAPEASAEQVAQPSAAEPQAIEPAPEKIEPAAEKSPKNDVSISDGGVLNEMAASSADTSPAMATAKPADPPPCPDEMALVGRTCVDRYEAHLVVELAGVLSPHPHYERPETGVRYLAKSAPGVFPQGYISAVEAKAACNASGKRLCSRREWLRACQDKGNQTYPYGPKGRRGVCNTGKLHLLPEVFGRRPVGGLKYDEHFNSPKLNQMPGFLAQSGEYTGCAGGRNIFDMVGNLHEWVSDKVDDRFMEQLDSEDVERREQPWSTGNGVFMGGFYSTTSELGPGCYYTTVAHEPRYHDYSTGFRCCADAVLPPTVPASAKAKKKGG